MTVYTTLQPDLPDPRPPYARLPKGELKDAIFFAVSEEARLAVAQEFGEVRREAMDAWDKLHGERRRNELAVETTKDPDRAKELIAKLDEMRQQERKRPMSQFAQPIAIRGLDGELLDLHNTPGPGKA